MFFYKLIQRIKFYINLPSRLLPALYAIFCSFVIPFSLGSSPKAAPRIFPFPIFPFFFPVLSSLISLWHYNYKQIM